MTKLLMLLSLLFAGAAMPAPGANHRVGIGDDCLSSRSPIATATA